MKIITGKSSAFKNIIDCSVITSSNDIVIAPRTKYAGDSSSDWTSWRGIPFILNSTCCITGVNLWVWDAANSGSFVVEIYNNNAGVPGSRVGDGFTVTKTAAQIPDTESGYQEFLFSSTQQLSAGYYWAVIKSSAGINFRSDSQTTIARTKKSTNSGSSWSDVGGLRCEVLGMHYTTNPTELISNGTFEGNNTTGWSATGSGASVAVSTEKNSGTYGMLVTRGATAVSAYINFTTEVGVHYKLSVALKKGTATEVYPRIYSPGPSLTTYYQTIMYSGETTWTTYELGLISTETEYSFVICLTGASGVTCYIDDVSVKRAN